MGGISSGLKSVGKGLAAGVATIVGAPIIGAREKGAKGLISGIIGGVLAGTTLMAAGVGVGN